MKNDIAYKFSCQLFCKMTENQLLELKEMLETDMKTNSGGELMADIDMLEDLERYMKERKLI